jgi:hypothetical protein
MTSPFVEHIKEARRCTERTAKAHARNCEIVASLSTQSRDKPINVLPRLTDFQDWIAETDFEDIRKAITEKECARATKVNYWKALKSACRKFKYPYSEWGKIKKEHGKKACLESTYVAGTKPFCLKCDKEFDKINSQIVGDRDKKVPTETQKHNYCSWDKIQQLALQTYS